MSPDSQQGSAQHRLLRLLRAVRLPQLHGWPAVLSAWLLLSALCFTPWLEAVDGQLRDLLWRASPSAHRNPQVLLVELPLHSVSAEQLQQLAQQALRRLVKLYEAEGKPEKAAQYRELLAK